MTADFSPEILEGYIVAQYAQWAGDYQYAAELFSQIASPNLLQSLPPQRVRVGERAQRNITNQDELLRVAAAERLNGILGKVEEFNRLRLQLPAPFNTVSHMPTVLTGRHLRGTI